MQTVFVGVPIRSMLNVKDIRRVSLILGALSSVFFAIYNLDSRGFYGFLNPTARYILIDIASAFFICIFCFYAIIALDLKKRCEKEKKLRREIWSLPILVLMALFLTDLICLYYKTIYHRIIVIYIKIITGLIIIVVFIYTMCNREKAVEYYSIYTEQFEGALKIRFKTFLAWRYLFFISSVVFIVPLVANISTQHVFNNY